MQMNAKASFAASVAALFCLCADAADFSIAVCGEAPRAAIVLPGNPGVSRKYAAEELSKYVRLMTGVKIPVGERGGEKGRIVIAADDSLAEDGFRIVCRDGELVVSGSEARGALYGVYALLERFGCVFCAPDCEKVPTVDALRVPVGLDVSETPAFPMRDSINVCTEDPAFCAKIRRNNKAWRPLPAKYGGNYLKSSKTLVGHTFETLISPKEFFASHPEYFSEVKGKRVGERSQLCLTNPDVLEIVAGRVLAAMRAEPDARLFAVSPNDWYNHCTCAKCRAIDEREGSPSGSYIEFINALARRTAKEFPKNYIRASAYMHTRLPPKTLKLEKNVFISLSPIECDYYRPIDESGYIENKKAVDEMRRWLSLGGGFFKYTDYTANFSHYPIAFPNLDSIAGSLRFCRRLGIGEAYDLGAHDSPDCFMEELRSWVFMKLAWNPDLDTWKLVRQFCDIYYGAAADIAYNYLKTLHSLPRDSAKNPLTLHESCACPTVPDDFLDWAWGEWTRAEGVAAGDKALLRRVRAVKFSTAYHILGRRLGDVVAITDAAKLKSLHGVAKWTVGYVSGIGRAIRVAEHGKPFASTGTYLAWKRFAEADPEKMANGRGVAEEDVFTIYELGKECEIVDDADAGNGKAVRIFPKVRNWVVQLKSEVMTVDPGEKYAIRVRAKVGEGDCAAGKIVFRAGVSRRGGKDSENFTKAFQRKSAAVGKYKWYDIGEFTPEDGRYIWVSGEGPGGLYVDCIEIHRASRTSSIYSEFAEPLQSSKPWTYWFWANSLTDRETMAEELSDIAALGFGGLLLTDSRGYYDDGIPPAPFAWGSEQWIDTMAFAVREAAKRGLKFSLNVAASGGHLRGDVDVGADAPKRLLFREYSPGESFETPESPHFRDIAVFAVKTGRPPRRDGWKEAGDGIFTMAGLSGRKLGEGGSGERIHAGEVREIHSAAQGAALGDGWTVLRFGYDVVPNCQKDIDVLDSAAVRRHLDRVIGALLARVGDLSGKDRTFAYLYNVSWEGMMPTWSVKFEEDFRRFAGYDLRPILPALAGFDFGGADAERVMRDFRRSRGEMMRMGLYATVREWAHERGLGAFSESAGPWTRTPQTFGECDQLAFAAENDFPQGEFWPRAGKNWDMRTSGHANCNGRFMVRGIASAAHVYGRPVASAEAFTHMFRHWSVDPAFLKPIGDQAFADGINLMVWHTYTTAPRRYGTPGIEYFAGSHINRHVTWHDGLPPFVRYLARCQSMLQRGAPVTDIAVLCGDRPYCGWGLSPSVGTAKDNGRYRNRVSEEIDVTVPSGYAFDMVNDDAVAKDPGLLGRYRVVYDARGKEKSGETVDVGSLPPDVETASNFTWCHRRDGSVDFYFVVGEGDAELVFRASSRCVEIWDAVDGSRATADAAALFDGRTRVKLSLPVGGSCFVVFAPSPADGKEATPRPRLSAAEIGSNGWKVSFAHHPWVSAPPPAPVSLDALVDFTTREDVRHFSGTASYRTTFDAGDWKGGAARISLGEVPSGLARVLLNGKDCGTAWCAPWEVDVAAAMKSGRNELEIRYMNNWHNRLVGDCSLPEEKRVTKAMFEYFPGTRTGDAEKHWTMRPHLFRAFAAGDALQPSGILGPVRLLCQTVNRNPDGAVFDPALDPKCRVATPPCTEKRCDAPWMWYPGQLQAYRQAQILAASKGRCVNVDYPGRYNPKARAASFRTKIRPGAIHMSGTGRTRNDGGYVVVEVSSDGRMPALIAEGTKPGDWEASLDGKTWRMVESDPSCRRPGVPPDAWVPEVVEIPSARRIALSKGEWIEDFRYIAIGVVSFTASGKGVLAFVPGETVRETRCDDEKLHEQFPVEPVRIDGDGVRVSLPERAMRYMRFKVTEGSVSVSGVTLAANMEKVEPAFSFKSDDGTLNDIVAAGLGTLHASMSRGFHIDGLKRDFLPWSMDAMLCALSSVWCFENRQMVRNDISIGAMPPNPKAEDWGCVDYPLHAIFGVEADYLKYRDLSTFAMYRDRLEAQLALYDASADADGFVPATRKALFGYIPGWARYTGPEGFGTPAYAQMMLLLNYRIFGRFYARLGETARAEECTRKAERLRESILRRFYDAERRVFVNGYRENGKLDTRISHHAQYWAILADVFPSEDIAHLFDEVLPRLPRYATDISYEKGYELLAYVKAGRVADFHDRFIMGAWRDWLAHGHTAFPEHFSMFFAETEQVRFYGRPFGRSLCHGANGTVPVLFALRGALGFREGERAGEYSFSPVFVGKATRYEATLRVPEGEMSIVAEKGKPATVKAPEGVRVLVSR